jgi:hypothetical protein
MRSAQGTRCAHLLARTNKKDQTFMISNPEEDDYQKALE